MVQSYATCGGCYGVVGRFIMVCRFSACFVIFLISRDRSLANGLFGFGAGWFRFLAMNWIAAMVA